MKKHLANFVTTLNLICGCFGIGYLFNYDIITASYFVFIAAIFDFLDGFVARKLNAQSPFGKDLDSLADVVSFGVLPGLIMFVLLNLCFEDSEGWQHYLPYSSFLIPVFSALRLAKFNNDTKQKENFIGLPTPANALFIASIPFIIQMNNADESNYITELFGNPGFLSGLVIILSFLLVSPLPLFSLKLTSLTWKDNSYRYIFLGVSVILILLFKFLAVPLILVIYIILSIIQNPGKK